MLPEQPAHGQTPLAVLVYRTRLLAASEPWVVTQTDHVPGVVAHYLGHQRVAGGTTPADRTTISRWGPRPVRLVAFLFGLDPVANRLVRTIRPALLHAHFGPDAMFAAATARRYRLPLVVSIHGYEVTQHDSAHSGPGGRLWLRRRTAVFRQAALLLANSTYTRDCLLQLGAPPERVVVQHVGVDTTEFAPTPDIARASAEVLFVGRLVAQKGIHALIRAMAVVRAAVPDARLTVIGDGPERATVEHLARTLGVAVDFRGSRPHAEVRHAMATATVLCGPSTVSPTGQREALGLVYAEAQACGLPVVACRSGGVPDVVIDGAGGVLVEEDDVDALAAALVRIVSDPSAAVRMGQAGRAHIVEHFDLATQSAALADHYHRVLGR
jgi:glycosyltransferase involved in cell wall biosynthesis